MVPQRAVAEGFNSKIDPGVHYFLTLSSAYFNETSSNQTDTTSPSNDSFGNEPKDKALILKHIDLS